MSITLRLPSVLKVAVGADEIRVTGATVRAAFDAACDELPNLRQHLLLDNGDLATGGFRKTGDGRFYFVLAE